MAAAATAATLGGILLPLSVAGYSMKEIDMVELTIDAAGEDGESSADVIDLTGEDGESSADVIDLTGEDGESSADAAANEIIDLTGILDDEMPARHDDAAAANEIIDLTGILDDEMSVLHVRRNPTRRARPPAGSLYEADMFFFEPTPLALPVGRRWRYVAEAEAGSIVMKAAYSAAHHAAAA